MIDQLFHFEHLQALTDGLQSGLGRRGRTLAFSWSATMSLRNTMNDNFVMPPVDLFFKISRWRWTYIGLTQAGGDVSGNHSDSHAVKMSKFSTKNGGRSFVGTGQRNSLPHGDTCPIQLCVNDDFLLYSKVLYTSYVRERDIYRMQKCWIRFHPFMKNQGICSNFTREEIITKEKSNFNFKNIQRQANFALPVQFRRIKETQCRHEFMRAALFKTLNRGGGDLHVERVAMSSFNFKVMVVCLLKKFNLR